MKGMHCSILQPLDLGNCSNGGLSSRVACVTLLSDVPEFPVPALWHPDGEAPGVVLRTRNVFGREYLYAVPADVDPALGPLMHGGCFVHSCDSRFPCRYPIPLHDRQESSRHE
jgi:hypothetical protein